jgi:hypothetical protein
MALPAVAFPGQRPQDLQGLDTLLAKPTAVQHRGTGREARIRQKGLHNTTMPPPDQRKPIRDKT